MRRKFWLAVCAALVVSSPLSAGLIGVSLYDNTTYRQTSGAAPTTPSSYFFNIGGNTQSASDFTSVSASYPGTASKDLPISGTNFGFSSPAFMTLSSLHVAFPFGTYTITAANSGTSASQSGVMTYAADYFTSDIPALTAASYNGLNGLNTAGAITVSFNAFTPNANATQGLTFFSIYDGSNIVFTEGFLTPNTTSVTVPGGTLQPNKFYQFELDFSDRLSGYDQVNRVYTEQGFDVRTDGSFTTGAATPEPGTGMLLAGALGLGAVVRFRAARRVAGKVRSGDRV